MRAYTSPLSQIPCSPFRGSWPTHVFGDYDEPRIVNRIGPAQAFIATPLLLTSSSTSTLYSEILLTAMQDGTELPRSLCLCGP